MDSLLVLTGVTDVAQLLTAVPEHRPTYVAADLRGLLVGQPEVVAGDGGVVVCGGWRASVSGGELVLESAREVGADVMDGVRALCGAAWSAAGDGAFGLDAGKALSRLGW